MVKSSVFVAVVTAVSMVGMLSGCVSFGKSTIQSSTDLGRQLMDLKQAKDQGLLSDEEYQIHRDQLL